MFFTGIAYRLTKTGVEGKGMVMVHLTCILPLLIPDIKRDTWSST